MALGTLLGACLAGGLPLPLSPAAAESLAPAVVALQTEPRQRDLGRWLTSFDLGVFWLGLGESETWGAAQHCLAGVASRTEFRDSPEVLTDLGYSELRQYYASDVAATDLARIGWPVSCQTFVIHRPTISGVTAQTWKERLQEAIGHFRRALAAAPEAFAYGHEHRAEVIRGMVRVR